MGGRAPQNGMMSSPFGSSTCAGAPPAGMAPPLAGSDAAQSRTGAAA